jgi:hypothetical protein
MAEINDQDGIIRQEQNVCGLTVNVPVAGSVADFDRLAKKEGACLAEANRNVTYRGTSAVARRLLCEAIEKETGIVREKIVSSTKEVTDEDGNVSTEDVMDWAPQHKTEKKYFDAVCAEKDCELSAFSHLIGDIEAQLVFDPSERESNAKPKKLAKMYYDAADTIIEQGAGDQVADALSAELGHSVDADRESLAKAICEKNKKADLAGSLIAQATQG